MIAAMSDYIRNLAIFLLFMSFMGMVTPDGKIKKYLNLVMGFVLLFLMASPVLQLTQHLDEVLDWAGEELSVPVAYMVSDDMARQRQLIAETASQTLSTELLTFLENQEVQVRDVRVYLSLDEKDFLDIQQVKVRLGRPQGQVPLVQIERIRPFESVGMSEEGLAVKHLVAGFYHLPLTHIHVIEEMLG